MAGEPQPKQPVGFGLPKRRSGLRQVGRRGRAKRAAMQQVPLGGRCEAAVPGVCTGTAEHRHHRRRASQGGTEDRSNLVLICHRCHEHVHANPGWAFEVGLLSRTQLVTCEAPRCVAAGVVGADMHESFDGSEIHVWCEQHCPGCGGVSDG